MIALYIIDCLVVILATAALVALTNLYRQGVRLRTLDGGASLTGVHPKDYLFDTSHIVTVFCQGNGASRAQGTKYAGPGGMIVRLDDSPNYRLDHVYIENSPRLLYNLYAWPDLDDIGYGVSWNPVHWISALAHDVVLKMGYNLRGMHSRPHNRPTYLNVAGERDVAQYLDAVRQCIATEPTRRIVLFGTSRGASTVLLAMRHLSTEEKSHIALALVEGPFDTIQHVTDWRFGRAAPLVRWAMRTFALYREDQASPLEALRHAEFPLDIPLAFIRSKVDTVVPEECTRPLLIALKARNHPALHELVLERSHHSRMSLDDARDQESYLRFVYDLYGRYVAINNDKNSDCSSVMHNMTSRQAKDFLDSVKDHLKEVDDYVETQ